MLEFTGSYIYKGFELASDLKICQSMAVLTGKNGSGKTRFLEAVANGAVIVKKNDEVLDLSSVKMIQHKALIPQFHSGYDENTRKEKVRYLTRLVLEHGESLDQSLGINEINQQYVTGLTNRSSNIHLSEAHQIIGLIAQKLGKKSSEISGGEIESYYAQYEGLTFGSYGISGLFNDYMKRKENNLYFRWLKEERGRDDLYYVPEELFEVEFGSPPWLELNKILRETFNGKFEFSEPGIEYDPKFIADLHLSADGTLLEPEDLSSGEQTLLWIVLTIFNTGFSKLSNKRLPTLLLIDEPDAFLHPSMVLKMLHCFEYYCNSFNSTVIITTHAPTTVALAPSDSIYVADNNKICILDQDAAISELIVGVTQISINAHNRRQVYVESSNDVEIFQMLYGAVLHKSNLIDKKISLSFVSAGMKFPKDLVSEKLKEHFGQLEPDSIEEYKKSINGVGGCRAVIGSVEHLCEAGATTVRGLIDRDKDNKPNNYIHVLGGGVCYAIENLILDPICIMLDAHFKDNQRFSMIEVCGANVSFDQWLADDELLQVSVDRYIELVFQRPNRKDLLVKYLGGKCVLSDSGYMDHNGHSLWKDIVRCKFDLLARSAKTEAGILKEIVRSIMLLHTKGDFIPLLFVEAFSALQK